MLDTVDQHRAAQIVMAHRVILDNALTDYEEQYFSSIGLLTQLLRHLHDLDKGVLRDLLVPAVAAQIHLDE